METKTLIQPYENGRTKVEIAIQLGEDEMKELDRKQCSRHLDVTKPIPCQFYQTANPAVRTIKGQPELNGQAIKAYVLPGARTVCLNRAIPGKTLLRITFPGRIMLGFANPQDIPRFKTWWKATEEQIKTDLKSRIFEVQTTVDIKPLATEEKKSEVQLNPIDPAEQFGVRRRSLEEF